MKRFLVAVEPPRTPARGADPMNYSMLPRPRIEWIPNCKTAAEAANRAKVEPGGRVHVIAEEDVETFIRAEVAPLVSTRSQVRKAAA